MRIFSTRLLFACFIVGTLLAAPAMAAVTRYVSATGDDANNDCTDSNVPCETIQYAVDQANADDTILVAGGTYRESVHIRQSLTLLGAGSSGAGKTTISASLGQGSDPSIYVDGVDTGTVLNVTIQDMDVSGNPDNDGIRVNNAQTAITNSVISNNDRDGVDVLNASQVTITGSEISDNGQVGVFLGADGNVSINAAASGSQVERAAADDGPQATIIGCTVSGNTLGGVIVEGGFVDIRSSTLDSNIGAGVVADGVGTQAAITNSTVSNTVPFADGGGAFGGGVLVFPGGVATIGVSTISGNVGQGILAVGAAVTVENSTISGTQPPPAGGAYPEDFPAGGLAIMDVVLEGIRTDAPTSGRSAGNWRSRVRHASQATKQVLAALDVSVTGTIIASQAQTVPDCSGTLEDGGYNLDSDGSCALTTTGSLSGVDAQLGPPSDNGGPTMTMLPAVTSPALDAIPTGEAGCIAGAADQRGIDRPQPSSGACDIGAVEARQVALSLSVGEHGSVTAAADPSPIGSGIGTCSNAICVAQYEIEAGASVVVLTAAPEANWHVVWSGDCIDNGDGTASVILDADKACSAAFAIDTYTIGGTVGGLVGTGLVLSLDSTDPVVAGAVASSQTLPVAGNGSFVFPTPLVHGSGYVVGVATQPSGPVQVCSVANGSGEVGVSDVASVQVTCATVTHVVTALVSGGQGTLTPTTQTVADGTVATLTVAAATGWHVAGVSGCNGTLSGNTYTTDAITADCTVTASFAIDSVTVTATVDGSHGSVSPPTQSVDYGSSATFTLIPDAGWHVSAATGCGGSWSGNTYTTGPITSPCSVQVTFAQSLPPYTAVPALDRNTLLLLMAGMLLLAATGLRRR